MKNSDVVMGGFFQGLRHAGLGSWVAITIFTLCTLTGSQRASAQAVYGTVYGTITDSTGAVVPNATVTVTNVSKNTAVSVLSDGNGLYRVEHLIPDTYTVSAEGPGFAKVTTENVIVHADTSPRVDITLTVGQAQSAVVVSAAAPLLQTEHTDVNVILNQRALESLPNLNRNFTAFELLTPGTSYIGWNVDESQNPQRSQQIEVNGQLPFATGYELDGTDNQDPVIGIAVINPNLDAVSEMKVTSQNYDAEFGKAVAGLVTAQTKSGSNNFHGSAFWYRRSDAQQARDPFTQATRDPITNRFIPRTLHNQFGGSIGGPIIKNKVFFFTDYQGLREKSGVSGLFTVPTAQARSSCLAAAADPTNPALTCDLSQYLPVGQLYDPASTSVTDGTGRLPFVNNQIPGSRLSAPSINLLKMLPNPNNGAPNLLNNNFTASGTGSFHTNQADARIDDQVSDKLHLFGRYTFFNSTLDGGSVFGDAGGSGFGTNGFAGHDTSQDHSLASGGDYTLSPTWLTDFRFGWFRYHFDVEPPSFNEPLGTELGIPGVNQEPLSLNGGLPSFNIDGLSTYGTTTAPFILTEDQFQGTNNWSHIVGRHNIKFGVDVRYARLHAVGLDNNNFRSGNFHSTATNTGAMGTGPLGPTVSPGVGLATFLLGNVTAFQRTQTADTNAQEHQWRFFYYGQDQWRVTNTFTFNYGLRWEWYFPEAVNGKGKGGLLDLNTGTVRIAGYGPWGNDFNVQKSWTNFAPRVGITWQARPNLVVRSGYGRVYGIGWSGNFFGEVPTFSFPVQVSQNLIPSSNFASLPFNLSQGPPAYVFDPIPASGNFPLPNGISVPTRPLRVRLPTLDAWNLAVQQEINRSTAVQIAYLGSHGTHNMFDSSNQFDPNQGTLVGFGRVNTINPVTPGDLFTYNNRQPYFDGDAQLLGVGFGHPFGWTQGLRYNINAATSSYNALQVKLEKRFSHGFQLLSHFTWSKALTHESYYYAIDPKVGYGPSYYNRGKAFVASGNWELPVGRGRPFAAGVPRWLDYIIGGYSVDGTVTAQSGLPYTPSYALCSNDQDIGICRPSTNFSAYQVGAGKFNPQTRTVQYFTPSPYQLGGPNPAGGFFPTTFGPYVRPPSGTFGNIFRNSIVGPDLVNVDMAVAKSFPIRENLSVQFRAEAFNLLNHPNLGEPNSCVDCQNSNAGQITSIVASQDGSSMRRLQFAVRVQF